MLTMVVVVQLVKVQKITFAVLHVHLDILRLDILVNIVNYVLLDIIYRILVHGKTKLNLLVGECLALQPKIYDIFLNI